MTLPHVIDDRPIQANFDELVKLLAAVPSGGGGSSPDASATVKGISKLSLAPASAIDPIAAGTNDSRLSDSRTPTAHAHAQADVTGLAASLAAKADASTVATDAELAAHEADTTAVHGIADTSALVLTSDGRLTNARTPTAHAATHAPGGADALAVDAVAATGSLRTLGATATSAAAGNDARLSDARTPSALSVVDGSVSATAGIVESKLALASDAAAAVASRRTLGAGAQQAMPGNTAIPANDNPVYRTILDVTGSLAAGLAAGTRGFGHGALIATGSLVTAPLDLFYLAAADYAVAGLTARLRVKAQLVTNATAPTGNFTVGLHPVSAVAGAAGGVSYTIGAAVASSTALFTAPALSSRNQAVSADIAFPVDGFYCLGVVTSAAVAASSYVHLSPFLQMRST